ncbi:hypothetical protein U1Q18_034108 [Sarracenia purpurea var. burkii]
MGGRPTGAWAASTMVDGGNAGDAVADGGRWRLRWWTVASPMVDGGNAGHYSLTLLPKQSLRREGMPSPMVDGGVSDGGRWRLRWWTVATQAIIH